MHSKSLIFDSWLMFVIATLSWCGVGFFIFTVLQMQSERAAYVADAATANLQEGQAAQLHALARDTMQDRAFLERTANVDVLTAVNTIESVSASGTSARVTNAQPVKVATKNAAQMSVVDLSIHSEGPFSSLMRVLQMLETIPLNTSVQEVNLSAIPADAKTKNAQGSWSLNMRLRFYTSATLST